MRNKIQERVEELARERRAVASGEGGTIDLALVEEGIEIGKKMMAEMIATYPAPGASPSATPAAAPAQEAPAAKRGGYLNEVSALNAQERREKG